jgi:ribonuclease HI
MSEFERGLRLILERNETIGLTKEEMYNEIVSLRFSKEPNGLNTIDIYTDGSSLKNPGPGGWGYVVLKGSIEIHCDSDGETCSTNNKMELTAAIKALEYITSTEMEGIQSVCIFVDSIYVKNGITSWIKNWKKNGWKTSQGKDVQNKELWVALDGILTKTETKYTITWKWVKAHNGNYFNEKADALARKAAESFKLK